MLDVACDARTFRMNRMDPRFARFPPEAPEATLSSAPMNRALQGAGSVTFKLKKQAPRLDGSAALNAVTPRSVEEAI